jgi:formylmethanofuran dehydrogenase subunit E
MAESKYKRFHLICVWCGEKIRENRDKDLEGMCLDCFYRMLNERMRAGSKKRAGQRVSER